MYLRLGVALTIFCPFSICLLDSRRRVGTFYRSSEWKADATYNCTCGHVLEHLDERCMMWSTGNDKVLISIMFARIQIVRSMLSKNLNKVRSIMSICVWTPHHRFVVTVMEFE